MITKLIFSENKYSLLFLILSLSFLIGIMIVKWQLYVILVVGIIVAIVILTSFIKNLSLTDNILFFVLAGYVILSYGFANLILPINLPLPLGHILGLVLLVSMLFNKAFRSIRFETTFKYWLALLILTIIHLAGDLSRFGIYAIRDSLFILEGSLLLWGFIWAHNDERHQSFFKIFSVIFILNLLYSYTFPFGNTIYTLSPQSGVFKQTAIFGYYSHNYLYLLVGAIFFLFFGERVLKLPKAWNRIIIILQLGGLLILQARSMYVAVPLVFLVLYKYGKASKAIGLMFSVVLSAILITSIISFADIKIKGRIGDISIDFILNQINTIIPSEKSTDKEGLKWRLKLMNEVLDNIQKNSFRLIWGGGFGEVLITFSNSSGAIVRQPHNTHLSVLARLGLVGLTIWLVMYIKIILKLVKSLRYSFSDVIQRDIRLWLLIYILTGLLLTSVQPWLEFSYGAIPFYIIVGYALGTIKFQNGIKLKSG